MSIIPLPSQPAAGPAGQWTGRVVQTDPDGMVHVACEDAVRRACRVAASCLLAPAEGDSVLVAGTGRSRPYVLAVLEQADPAETCIAAAGTLTVRAPNLRLHGEEVDVRGARALELHAASLGVKADSADCRIADVRYAAEATRATLGTLRLVARLCETFADRTVAAARNALRVVAERDESRVGHLDCQAAHTARLHARHTLVTGDDLVKVDAAQIHVG